MRKLTFFIVTVLFIACNNNHKDKIELTRLSDSANFKSKYNRYTIIELDSIIRKDSTDADAYFFRGFIYKNNESTQVKAYNDFDKSIRLGLKKSDAYYYRAKFRNHIEWGSSLDIKAVLKDLNMALKIDSTNSNAYFQRAEYTIESFEDSMNKKNQDFEIIPNIIYLKAINDLTKSIKYKNNNASAYFMRARYWCEIGDKSGSHSDYKKAKQLNSSLIDDCK